MKTPQKVTAIESEVLSRVVSQESAVALLCTSPSPRAPVRMVPNPYLPNDPAWVAAQEACKRAYTDRELKRFKGKLDRCSA